MQKQNIINDTFFTTLIFLFFFFEFTFAQDKPNIIFIMADDLGYGDVGAYGQVMIQTPNIDRLSRGGIQFSDFYSGAAVCAPARSVLMTGLHTGHTYPGQLWKRRGDWIGLKKAGSFKRRRFDHSRGTTR